MSVSGIHGCQLSDVVVGGAGEVSRVVREEVDFGKKHTTVV